MDLAFVSYSCDNWAFLLSNKNLDKAIILGLVVGPAPTKLQACPGAQSQVDSEGTYWLSMVGN